MTTLAWHTAFITQECGKSKPGHEFILRSDLSSAVRRVRGNAEMSPQEWQAFHTYFDSDTSGGEPKPWAHSSHV